MIDTQKLTLILFKLPDGKIVLQRRTRDAPYGAGLLGIFGGWVEENETVDECLKREIIEETSLDPESLDISLLSEFIIPACEDFAKDRHFYLYKAQVNDTNFKVYEGEGAEAYSLEAINQRNDLTGSAKYTFSHIYKH